MLLNPVGMYPTDGDLVSGNVEGVLGSIRKTTVGMDEDSLRL